ncbi:FAD-dependent oxidoreductase [Desulfonema ishimotonii]|uniref:FAD-dependent oxidoreductase n=1 Tax=Desulfonema ishimotonii TaxID=45657 RepID=A0A401FWV2_9BACT|nr:FAD-dependent oxidoreductase [Desulfonema ishimotonii]GBC61458.1 FAD-dependent oxidoreductase [Desulfonema ishimotonii]
MFSKKKRLLGDNPPLKSTYDAVIIGGGLHGLATAYFLATRHGMTNVAVIEKRFIGFGAAGRNTAIVRANQRTQENLPLYKEALDLWPVLTKELDFNLMFYNCGNLNLAHSEAAVKAMRLQVASAQFHGIESHLVDPQQCKELVPALDITDKPRYPIYGGMYHPPGGIVRHDAVVWGLAKGAAKRGVHIHQGTAVTGINVENGKVASVDTDKGKIHTSRVLNAAGGYSAALSYDFLGIRLPISVLTIQAMVTQPLKPLLHHVVSSGMYHCYANQTLKGEIATGAHMDAWPNYTTQNTAHYIKHQAEALTEFLPCLKGIKFMRCWAGLADMTPDMAPIMDGNDQVEGYYMDCGWGYFGFKSSTVTGKYMAEFMATGEYPEILKPFTLRRFKEHRLMGETAALVSYSADN